MERRNQYLSFVYGFQIEQDLILTLSQFNNWIMHCLWGLQQKFQFEMKGGTSLSKGFRMIDRFSEDIDIRIDPPKGMDVKTGKSHDKPSHFPPVL